jgi:hypothetical protein
VGIAGPRGVGKTTILQAYKAGLFLKAGEEQIVVLETVPVAYEARDFILHLYFQLCSHVVAFVEQHSLRARERVRKPRFTQRHLPIMLLTVLTVIWIPILRYVDELYRHPNFKLPVWLVRSGPSLALGLGLSIVLVVWQRRERQERPPEPVDFIPTDLKSLRELAQQKMMNIKFQQSRTYGWAGKLGMPMPYSSEITKTHEWEVTSKALTYPEIVADFQRFLESAVTIVKSVPNLAHVPVVLILDELDKISSLQGVREFINEAKGFMRMQSPGVLCLISVSEDALTSFEQRGLPARDSLDSAFDTVLDMGYLALSDSTHLLNRRVIGMSLPFVCFCHCFAGGLPRELVRVARDVVDANSSTLDGVCVEIVANDLQGKLASWRTSVIRSGASKAKRADLIWYLNTHSLAGASSSGLFKAVESLLMSGKNVTGGNGRGLADADDLQEQIVIYLYFCATLLEIFTQRLSEEQVKEASTVGGPGSFDALATVRQQFSVSPRVAWLTLNAFREAWTLATVDYPDFGGI